ncbi:hypothetical protein ACE6H2_016966 [Prunus campanulata]
MEGLLRSMINVSFRVPLCQFSGSSPFLSPSQENSNSKILLSLPRIFLVVYLFAVATVSPLQSNLRSEIRLWRCWLCSLMVHLDPYLLLDRLSIMHVGGLLPQLHALQIPFVGSPEPSCSSGCGGGGRLGGGGCLVYLGFDSRVFVFLGFLVISGFFVFWIGLVFCLVEPLFFVSDFCVGLLCNILW